jgi:hypothetical protein
MLAVHGSSDTRGSESIRRPATIARASGVPRVRCPLMHSRAAQYSGSLSLALQEPRRCRRDARDIVATPDGGRCEIVPSLNTVRVAIL